MGQVPHLRYGIVGDGRMARHMARYLELLGTPASLWSRRVERETGVGPAERLEDCDVILLLISDGAIEPFIEAHPFLRTKKILHFSGALITPLCPGFHPLMTFGAETYDRRAYEDIPFICEAAGPDLTEIFPHFPNPHYSIQKELKPLYHALCVMSGNFTVMLWQKIFRELPARIEVPAEAALPYLRRITRNLETNPGGALTGPIQRGDIKTIAANLEALEGDPFRVVYEAFVQAAGQDSRGGVKV